MSSRRESEIDPERGQIPENTNEPHLILDPADPLPSARHFVKRFHKIDQTRSLQHQSAVFFKYDPTHNVYHDFDEADVRSRLYAFLEPTLRWTLPRNDNDVPKLVAFKPNRHKVADVLDALKAICNLPRSSRAPCWIQPNSTTDSTDPMELLACTNGLLHLPTRQLLPATPNFFTLNGVDFDFDPKSPYPEAWLRFLTELWPDDHESIETLQEWFGYVLTLRTHFQKMLMLVGPRRSGKGTIGRVLRMLLGARNSCGPTLSNMAEQFGLSVLIDKCLAVIADARISGRTDTAVITERLLSISGEDMLSIPRKHLPDWTGQLSTRFMLMTNELPRIEDSSGAFVSRFILLVLNQSFYGREDHQLLEKFVPELPGILLWAIDGWERLRARGRFVQPRSSAELIQEFEDLASPIGAFIRDRCEVGKGHNVVIDELFQAWKSWCEDNGRHPGTKSLLSRNLRAAVPWLSDRHPHGQRRLYEGISLKGEQSNSEDREEFTI